MHEILTITVHLFFKGLGFQAQSKCQQGRFGELFIAAAPSMRTVLEGSPLRESRLRDKTGVTVVGMWERGKHETPLPDSRISLSSVLVIAGSEEHLRNYDRIIGNSYTFTSPVIILGGGRVGFATAAALKERGYPV